MAKQVGPLFFTGTIDGLIFYKVGDQYYTRSKGSYKSAKYMRRNPKYQRTMQNADQFGQASKLVGAVYYQHVPKVVRRRGLYGELTGRVKRWLQEGKNREEAQALLIAHCHTLATVIDPQPTSNKQPSIKNIQQKTTTQYSPTSINKQRSTTNAHPVVKPKQARYLSRWKVKRNGRLQVPQSNDFSTPAKCVVLQC